jgi:hypothetical protein
MLKQQIDNVINDIEMHEEAIKFLNYTIQSCSTKLKMIEQNEEKIRLKEYLLNILEDYHIEDLDVKTHIENIILNYERIEDEENDYLDAEIIINKIKINVYVDYRKYGNKTGGSFKINYILNNKKYLFNEDYDFIDKNLSYENAHILLKTLRIIKSDIKNDVIIKISMLIPKYFYKKIF